ncbi:restriction endonuclease subunit S [Pseudanabaena galeata UHCC 0370]|uniref:Restriction endonuclease subunit S n=1 Tax=Pseudanabaena galeata UHCC 0370 TaxID=3110310 RepID=A0ABU5TKC9_9CYAN|nr:restriction endonuclease subunit S [Pseudanabaena galeata]MEA5478724.1 restriction endonuclease subunit S [Pseudanabaena galeata UHCC 0370]
MQESKEKNIVCAFAHELAVFSGAKSLLHIQASQFNLFYDLYDLEFQEVNATANITENARYDLILGDLPLGLNVVEWKDGDGTIKTRQNWLEILKSLNHLEINGIGLFLLEPVGFSSNAGVIFENELNQRGLFVNSYINLPPSILEPYTSLVPVFVVISKKKSNKLFVVELLDDKQAREVARNYCSGVYGDNLANGKYIEASDYHGFYRIKVKDQIERLETQYKSYKEYKLGDLASIKSISKDKHFKECDNTMYIHKSKNSEIVCKISDIKFDHSNYFQVILEDVVINEYLALFFRSALGKLIIESLKSGEFRPVLAQSYLEQAIITLPTLEEQKDIVHTQNKLQVLKQAPIQG